MKQSGLAARFALAVAGVAVLSGAIAIGNTFNEAGKLSREGAASLPDLGPRNGPVMISGIPADYPQECYSRSGAQVLMELDYKKGYLYAAFKREFPPPDRQTIEDGVTFNPLGTMWDYKETLCDNLKPEVRLTPAQALKEYKDSFNKIAKQHPEAATPRSGTRFILARGMIIPNLPPPVRP